VSVPVWMLLGFAAWTVLLLLATVGYTVESDSDGTECDTQLPR
jgi:hypothetical protein